MRKAAFLLAAFFVLAPIAGAARGDVVLASRATGANGTAGDANSSEPSISADGRYVAFHSIARNLSNEDNDDYINVFVRDLQQGTTTLVSRADGPAGAAADGPSTRASISADGRYVAFESDADNLSTEDNNAYTNIFVRDVQRGTTTLVTRTSSGTAADDASDYPSISADGLHVAFRSAADNLSPDDNNSVRNIFVRDLAGTTSFVSRASDGGAADSISTDPEISADGTHVAFSSDADNLSLEDNDAYFNVFVRDLQAGTTTLVSRADGPAGVAGDDNSGVRSISGNGRHVAFGSSANNLSAEDNDAYANVFVRDVQAGTTTLVSRASGPGGAGGDDNSGQASISGDGRYVAFASLADNLSAEDDNAYFNIFVRDVQAGTTTLVSRAPGSAGVGGNGASFNPSISANGHFVAFQSDAGNLSGEDNDAVGDIFRRDLVGGPPRCSDSSAKALHNTPVSVPLTCVEDDGDAVSRAILTGPAHGTLGPIDQAAGTVTYTPAPRYSGPDSLTFRATDGNGTSNTATASLNVTLLPGRCANRLTGTGRGDRISGTTAGDRIRGLGGADTLNGLAGADCLDGGAGVDELSGGAGNDALAGGAGNDRLNGGSGRNTYAGGAGNDTILAVNRRRDTIDCGRGKDVVRADRRDRVRRCERVRRARR